MRARSRLVSAKPPLAETARSRRRCPAPARRALLVLSLSSFCAGTALVVSGAGPTSDEGTSTPETAPVLRIQVNSIIHPVAAEFIKEALEEAEATAAQALIVELNTPGGLLTSTREIFTAMLAAKTPVVIYVSPQGSQAASAGFFLLMAADVAAMAPGTNAGAAHPVGGQGEEIEGAMGEKMEQDAAATIRSLASQKGRNEELAESAVIESKSFTAREALEKNLIDLIATDIRDLLAQLEGRTVEKVGEESVLHTASAPLEMLEMTLFQRLRSTLAHPNIAYLLLTLGGLGIYFELSNPGAIFPGILGVICLILAFYALSVLPVNYAGIALMILSALFFLMELKVPSFGLLTVGGLTSLILGSILLFKSPDPAIRVSIQLILAVAAVALIVVVLLLSLVVRVHRRKVQTGPEGLIRERGIARTPLAPRGKVAVHGEIWDAIAEAPVAVGDEIEIVAVNGMTVKVQTVKS